MFLKKKIFSIAGNVNTFFIAPVVEKPLLGTIGLVSLIALILVATPQVIVFSKGLGSYQKLKYFLKDINHFKIAFEVFAAVIAYVLHIKKAISLRQDKASLTITCEDGLKEIKKKLSEVKFNLIYSVEDLNVISNSLATKWLGHKNFEEIEYFFVRRIISNLVKGVTGGKKLFLEYFVLDLYPSSKPTFIASVGGMLLDTGSPKHEFLSILNFAMRNLSAGKFDINKQFNLVPIEEAKKILKEMMSGNIAFYIKEIKDPFNREALLKIAETLIQKGHATIGNLLKHRRSRNPLKMLIKYGENFFYWEKGILEKIKAIGEKSENESLHLQVKSLMHPQPFSRALNFFGSEAIKLLPHDHFLYVFDLKRIRDIYGCKDEIEFMEKFVVVKAKEFHEEMIGKLRKIDKSLVETTKEFVKNYYIVDMDIQKVLVRADAKSTPKGLSTILVRDVMNDGNLPKYLSDNNIYIKEIIEKISPASILGLLEQPVGIVNFFDNYDRQIRRVLNSKKLSIKNIYEISNLTQSKAQAVKLISEFLRGKEYVGSTLSLKEVRYSIDRLIFGAKSLELLIEKGFRTQPAI